jgi:hypothetical protein
MKNEQKYPWLYESVVHQGYLCKFCELIISSVILELPLSVRGVGRRTQPISKLLNDLLITSALNPTCLVQSALNPTCLLQVRDFTHGYMTVWYTKGIYVSFVNYFEVILPHHTNLLLLALTLVRTVHVVGCHLKLC